jgi:hypothetical protein
MPASRGNKIGKSRFKAMTSESPFLGFRRIAEGGLTEKHLIFSQVHGELPFGADTGTVSRLCRGQMQPVRSSRHLKGIEGEQSDADKI